jgi:hypothetical protein
MFLDIDLYCIDIIDKNPINSCHNISNVSTLPENMYL